ncbi:GNAT family N-acetyltransferase [Flavobacterium selenitireducens]|uniref:GNAT family N-acetyltransferase n=1 Tax=Flavobacterium selenitireducens TaxID=2722704 RepID=UPI00168BFDCA|nr:GNAT family N-acetyltransferase [Flavobacterium selenitireducens]MBD3582723.1 GNAT family N-acetyltransferase [Flavobacterium selenitireducens]
MLTLTGNNVFLRALEPEDLDFVFAIENDESIWNVSNTQTPYSRFLIRQYLENAQQDIYEAKQLRLAIARQGSGKTIGLIDLFDYDPRNHRAGIGIVIKDKLNRDKGYGGEALELLIRYSFSHLGLHQLYANIATDNVRSVALFTKFGFVLSGVKKGWNRVGGKYEDEAFYQLINIR